LSAAWSKAGRHAGKRSALDTVSPRVDATLIKAVVRGHRWLEMLESGRFATIRELAKAEKINESYLGRVLRLTLLSPDIIQTILSGHQASGLELADFFKPFPLDWEKQKQKFLGSRGLTSNPKS
jgi:hypothetical protein